MIISFGGVVFNPPFLPEEEKLLLKFCKRCNGKIEENESYFTGIYVDPITGQQFTDYFHSVCFPMAQTPMGPIPIPLEDIEGLDKL